jgi:predicted dehydrogenase
MKKPNGSSPLGGDTRRSLKWGILSTAVIAREAMIPAMKRSKHSELVAIASREQVRAEKTAKEFGIGKAYGSYEELLADTEVEAVYIPLPNHLHVEWSLKALQAGKHVLVEKPVALNAEEAEYLKKEAERYPGLKIMEAFMYRFHPQWIKVKELIAEGRIGELKNIQSSFSFYDDDAGSIVNSKEYGGGSLMDIGCYPISLSRYIFGEEPVDVKSEIEFHPDFGTDVLATGIMKFSKGVSSFFSSTLLAEDQSVKIYGTKAFIEMKRPFNPDPGKVSSIVLVTEDSREEIEFGPCDQYTLEADAFSLAVLNDKPVPTPLTDAVNNMKVIDRLLDYAGRKVGN